MADKAGGSTAVAAAAAAKRRVAGSDSVELVATMLQGQKEVRTGQLGWDVVVPVWVQRVLM